MEQNLPLIAKKMWGIVRVVFFMLRKGISKSKLMVDLNIMLKRGKIASKTAITNLLMLHSRHESSSFVAPRDYEFSCSNTPAYDILHITKRRRHHHHHNFFACAHAPQTQEEDLVTVKAVLELLNSNNQTAASPALPGFGRSPMVRQLRVTDSPFPLKEVDEVDSGYVDKAAEEFIQKFYEELRNQKNY